MAQAVASSLVVSNARAGALVSVSLLAMLSISAISESVTAS
jgi:hypothetical protein